MSFDQIVCLYVDLARNKPVAIDVVTAYKRRIENLLVHATFKHKNDYKQHLTYFKIWCHIQYRLKPTLPCTLQQVYQRLPCVTPFAVAALVISTSSTREAYELLPNITTVATGGSFHLSDVGIKLCLGWLHHQLCLPYIQRTYSAEPALELVNYRGHTERLCLLLSNFYITQTKDIYDACFITRIGLLRNIPETLAFAPTESVFHSLSAFHFGEINAQYTKIQHESDAGILNPIPFDADTCKSIDWAIIAVFTIAKMLELYDGYTRPILSSRIDIPDDDMDTDTPDDTVFFWLDHDHKRLYVCDGQAAVHYDELIVYFLDTYFPNTVIANFLLRPDRVDSNHPILSMLDW